MKAVREFLLAMALIPATTGILTAQQDSGVKNPPAPLGAYTVEQSARGEQVYSGECARCHDVSDHTNSEFRFKWNGRTVRALYDYIRTTMPDDGPGELTLQQYLDVTAYMLKLNGMPAGDAALTSDTTVLGKFKLDFKALPRLQLK